jgi:hypothetical protein
MGYKSVAWSRLGALCTRPLLVSRSDEGTLWDMVDLDHRVIAITPLRSL